MLAWYLLVRPRRRAAAPGAAALAALFADILRVGARRRRVSTLQTTLTVALTTALVGAAGGAGRGRRLRHRRRLEYLLVPLVFGLGAPMVALVGTNIGAGQPARALRIALTGGALAFALTEAVGLAAAIWPQAWLGLFGDDPRDAGDRRRLPARSSGRPTASSASACRSTSPRRARGGCSGRCSAACCGC